jgi:hypothetical protein
MFTIRRLDKVPRKDLFRASVICILMTNGLVFADNVWTGSNTTGEATRSGTTTVKASGTYYKYVQITPDQLTVNNAVPSDHTYTTIERGKVTVQGTGANSTVIETNKITIYQPGPYSITLGAGTITVTDPSSAVGTKITGSGIAIKTTTNVVGGVTYPLAVKGKICAQELVVTSTGWSDYVFKKDYRLPELKDVERHISEKGTLPGIPSEKEVAAKGVSVGDMQAKLLAKVEELTLYVIKQQKEINELKSALKATKNIE